MKMIFRILDENNIKLTDELADDLLAKIHQKRDFNQLIQSAVIASAIFALVASVFDYFTNMSDPTVEMNAGLYIEVLALSLFTLGSGIAIVVSIYAMLTDMRKRILFNEVVEAINLNRHIEHKG